MSKLLKRNAVFIEEKCPKCGNFLLQNLWGQKWCWNLSSSKCDWFSDKITTNHPLPSDEYEDTSPTKTNVPKEPKKKKSEKAMKEKSEIKVIPNSENMDKNKENSLDFKQNGVNIYVYDDNGEILRRSRIVDQMHYDHMQKLEEKTKLVLECSSVGDKRFSAFGARVKSFGWEDAIEFHYMFSKGLNGIDIPNIKKITHNDKLKYLNIVKGKTPDYFILNGKKYDPELLPQWYHLLWVKYLDGHPELVEYASQFEDYNDVFKGNSVSCQADSIRIYVKEGRDSLMKKCKDLLLEMRNV